MAARPVSAWALANELSLHVFAAGIRGIGPHTPAATCHGPVTERGWDAEIGRRTLVRDESSLNTARGLRGPSRPPPRGTSVAPPRTRSTGLMWLYTAWIIVSDEWCAWQESNLLPHAPQACALSVELQARCA